MAKTRTRRVAINLITDHQDNILMGIRNDCHKWTTPGGHLDEGECPYAGAMRELQEEASLDATDIKLVKVEKNREKNLILYLFKVTVDPEQKPDASNDPDNECEAWYYVDPNDVKEDLHVPLEHNMVIKYWMTS